MSNQNSTQNERLKIVLKDRQKLEDFRWGYAFTEVQDEIVSDWRWGNDRCQVMKRVQDGRFFALHYRTGPDGTGFMDNNDLPMEACEVFPVTKTIIVYE